MRSIFNFLIVFLLVFVVSCSGNRKNEDIFTEFEGEKGVYMVKLPPALFLSLTGAGDANYDAEEMGDINFIKLLVYSQENNTREDVDNMFGRVNLKMSEFAYENILGFNSGAAYISAHILENEDYVSDLMLVMREGESLVCLGVSGELDGKKLFEFASRMDYDKLYNFIGDK